MLIRAARTIIAKPQRSGAVVFNFLRKTASECTYELLALLGEIEDWTEAEAARATWETMSSVDFSVLLTQLTEFGLVVIAGSAEGEADEEYVSKWEWGLASAALHFSTQNAEFMSLEQSSSSQADRLHSRLPPHSVAQPVGGTRIQPSREGPTATLLDLMAARRTNRVVERPAIGANQLIDCLYAGMGVTGAVRTPSGVQPLTMTPSGGARNPYEAFIIANNVEGWAPGVYHYGALDNSFRMVRDGAMQRPSQLLAGQDWVDPMPAIIILVAYLERTMWKYQDANAYRVVLIEAGHIGQNIMLAATAHSLSACPTAALSHATVSEYLALDGILQTPVYALTLSAPGAYDGELLPAAALLSADNCALQAVK